MKLAIYTSALEGWISGGIACIIEVLNELHTRGHEVRAFVDINGDKDCTWIPNFFPIYPANSEEFRNYDGVLVSPFSPTAKAVADHENASDRFYWVHTNEGVFNDNDAAWRQRAIDSYSLPLKIFCTSSYVQIIMEQMYNRNVIQTLVSPGYDPTIFHNNDDVRIWDDPSSLNVCFWNRGGWVRGVDVALAGIRAAQKKGVPINLMPMNDGTKNRNSVAASYRNAHVYLDASRLAGCPTPVIEAMACGTIPICTKYGTTDFVSSGYSGEIVGTDSPDDIAEAFCRLWNTRDSKLYIRSFAAMSGAKNKTWKHITNSFTEAIEVGQSRENLLKPRFSNV
jgi:glycosyltransferase involved in cell wall biosynthesis